MKRAISVALLLVCAVAVHAQIPQQPQAQTPQLPPLSGYAVTPLTITTTACPAIVLGQLFQCQFTALGGTPPYHWSVIAGTLPPGLQMTDDGLLTGTVNVCSNAQPTDCFIQAPQNIQMIMAGRTVNIPVEQAKKKHAKKAKTA